MNETTALVPGRGPIISKNHEEFRHGWMFGDWLGLGGWLVFHFGSLLWTAATGCNPLLISPFGWIMVVIWFFWNKKRMAAICAQRLVLRPRKGCK